MSLPPGFYWTTRSASRPDEPLTVVACQGEWVVSMSQRVNDGVWVAFLDRHRIGPGGPCRVCTSYELGRTGVELWIGRHEARLREDVSKIVLWRKAIRENRLAKTTLRPPFDGLE